MENDYPITTGGADYDEFDLDDDLDQVDGDENIGEQETGQNSQKLRKLFEFHPECQIDYIESIVSKLNIISGEPGSGVAGDTNSEIKGLDDNHKTFPFLTNYEKTAIIGLRSEVLSRGGQPYIVVPTYVTDIREIARMELEQKRLPYIIKRPLPNGSYEYWRLADLMII